MCMQRACFWNGRDLFHTVPSLCPHFERPYASGMLSAFTPFMTALVHHECTHSGFIAVLVDLSGSHPVNLGQPAVCVALHSGTSLS